MFDFPQTTYFGKLIPKTKFYDKLTIDKKVERSFIDQIASVRWVHKLSADTLNVSKGNTVDEIEVFLIKLKTPELDINVLKQMDRQLPTTKYKYGQATKKKAPEQRLKSAATIIQTG